MSFIQHCFIRKNTPELRKKLEELGYKPSYPIFLYPEGFKHIAACNFFGSKYYGVSDDEISHHGEIKDAIKNRGMIDCGENEDFFLAIAALRDDTDKNQYCIDSEGNWFLYNRTYVRLLSKTNVSWHKATLQELIEHFKK